MLKADDSGVGIQLTKSDTLLSHSTPVAGRLNQSSPEQQNPGEAPIVK